MTERQKMLAGELYNASDAELKALRERAAALCDKLDGPLNEEERIAAGRQLLGKCGEQVCLLKGFRCDYGCNIRVGENFFANYNVVILDVCEVSIGDNCLIAPCVGIYTAYHPLDRAGRKSGLECGKPVKIGNDCWIGGHAVINPGVTLGDNVIVGSGSVVTKSFPSDVVIAGNPARIIRRLNKEKKD